FFQAEDGIRDFHVTGVQTCALPIFSVRPGTMPIINLAEAAVDYMIARGSVKADERDVHVTIVASVLRSGQEGLTEVSRMIQQSRSEERRVGKECRTRRWGYH